MNSHAIFGESRPPIIARGYHVQEAGSGGRDLEDLTEVLRLVRNIGASVG